MYLVYTIQVFSSHPGFLGMAAFRPKGSIRSLFLRPSELNRKPGESQDDCNENQQPGHGNEKERFDKSPVLIEARSDDAEGDESRRGKEE